MKKSIKKPNFFIIGAPKCGTTALSEYLRTHPKIFFSDPKEPKFFSTDFSEKQRKFYSEEEYLELFKEAEKYKAVGEGSATYLYSQKAVPNILQFNPKAKFIVMVRNPVDMFCSLYYHLRFVLEEDAKTPEEAWRLQEERKKRQNIPKNCRETHLLQYGKVCKLGEQIERLYAFVPTDRVLVILFDDFKENTAEAYRKVLDFLELPYDNRINFLIVNKRRVCRSYTLVYLLKYAGRLKRAMGVRKRLGIVNVVNRTINRKKVNAPVLSMDFRKELINYFEEDIKKLFNITGKDLSHWRRV